MKSLRKAAVRLFLGLFILAVVLFFVLFFVNKGDYPVAQTVEHDSGLPHRTIGSATFHLETFGTDSNPPLLIVHGGPGNDYRYLLGLKDLADEYHVIFYDQRGTGLSPRVSNEQLHLDTMLQDLANIADEFCKDGKISIIGHSWGAMLASGYLSKYPENVDKIVLAEPGMLTSDQAKIFLERTQFRFSFTALTQVAGSWFRGMHVHGPDDQAKEDYMFMDIGLRFDMPSHPYLGYFCDREFSRESLPVWRWSARSSTQIIENGKNETGQIEIDLVTGADSFKGKVLLLTGECNTLIGPDYQKNHLKYFKNPEMVIVPDAGHMMFIDQKELCLKTVRDYLSE